MEHEMVLTKETLITYLLHELSGADTHKVTTYLDENGCWIGKLKIESSNEPNQDSKYYKALTESFVLGSEGI